MTTEALFDAAERGWKAGEAKQWQLPYFEMPTIHGALVARFILPLSLAKPVNQLMRAGMAGQAWAMGAHKAKVFAAMRTQHARRGKPLPGRPQIICVRFSIREPDRFSNYAKCAIDRLLPGVVKKVGNQRFLDGSKHLNFIEDDSVQHVDEFQLWWPVSRRADEVVVIKIFSGQEEAA